MQSCLFGRTAKFRLPYVLRAQLQYARQGGKLEIHVKFSCSFSLGTLLSYLSINAVNFSLRLRKTKEDKKVGKLGEQQNRLQEVKFQKQVINYYFFNDQLKV